MNAEARRRHYLQAMGIPVWALKPGSLLASNLIEQETSATTDVAVATVLDTEMPVANDTSQISATWSVLRDSVAACTACELHQTRTQTVFGVGNQQADWMLIGEAPGAEEDRRGEPFVGRAGQLLNEMLLAIGLQRSDVFIANILKCRPPNNRDPSVQEAAQCEHFLKQQIALIQPKIILSVGRVSAINLLNAPRDQAVGRLRGKVHRLEGVDIPVVVIYHPAYLLRSPREKRKAWDDLLLAKRVVSGEL